MGDVYAGIDEKLDRTVALKVLHAEHRLDVEARERLLREARALSKLDHPNICRIFDYIESRDVDVLVLEFIDGRTLEEVVLEGQLTRADRLRIASDVANVFVAAHRVGIVHRDLKPENVMITKTGEVKVLDFGLARWLTASTSQRLRAVNSSDAVSVPVSSSDNSLWFPVDDSSLTSVLEAAGGKGKAREPKFRGTAVGVTMGTPLYMSPEQARGENLSTASDMFSFGLLLQFLFTGLDPHPMGLSTREVMLRVARGETLPAEKVARDVGALIARLKQLAPADRLTAVETVARLRFLADKTRRLVRRSLSFAALFLVVFGIWRYTADLAVARAEAEERRAQAEDLINFMVGDLRGKLEPVQRLDILDDVAEKALKYVRSSKLESASPEELIAQVQALNQLGDVRISQGNLSGAMTLFRQSLERATVAVQRAPKNPEAKYALALSQFWLANGYRLQDQPARGMAHARAYLALTTELAEKYPANDKYVLESAYAHSQNGMLLEDQRDFPGAIAEFQRTLAIKEAYSARRPDDDVAKEDIARTMNKLAFAMQKNGDLRTALRYFENEVALREELVRRNPQQIRWKQDLAVSHSFLAWALEDLGHPEEALKQRLADVAVHQELVAHDPANKTWKRNLVRAHSSLGRLVGLSGELAEAERHLRAAEEGSRALVDAEPARASHRGDLSRSKAHYARVLLANGRTDAAGIKAAEAIEACGSDAANRGLLGYAWLVQGNVQERQGRNAAARDSWAEALELLRPGSANSSNVRELENWARVLIALDRRKEAADVVTRLRVLGFRYQDFEALCQSRGY